MKKSLLAILLGAVMSTSCATFVNGDRVSLPVSTTPSGATVTLEGRTYTTPVTLEVPRGEGDFNLHIEKPGYQPIDIKLTESYDGWLWGNLLIGGLLGLAIDFATGDAYDIEPEVLHIAMQAKSVSKTNEGGLNIVLIDINDLPPESIKKIRNTNKPIF